MSSVTRPLHVLLFPFPVPGHLTPFISVAKLLADRGVNVSILTAPFEAPTISYSLQSPIEVLPIEFPSANRRCDNARTASASPCSMLKFFEDTTLLQEPLKQILSGTHFDCLVSDMLFPWAVECATEFKIPTVVFMFTSVFFLSASEALRRHRPFDNVTGDEEDFIIPDFPGEITFRRPQIPYFLKDNNNHSTVSNLLQACKQAEEKCYGVITESFYEMEKRYIDYYINSLGRRAWALGPLYLRKTETEEVEVIDDPHCTLRWLNEKQENSVLYVSFGAATKFTEPQLREIAMGLEVSGHPFIWVVMPMNNIAFSLPDGFEDTIKGRGLVLREGAPQVKILQHIAVGGFLTHCGWASVMDSVSAGTPMITWPTFEEQYFNEKLVTDVLQVGVPVGPTEGVREMRWEGIEMAVKRVMQGEEAEKMKERAKKLAIKAKRSVAKGGSACSHLDSLINDLTAHRLTKSNKQERKLCCKYCCF